MTMTEAVELAKKAWGEQNCFVCYDSRNAQPYRIGYSLSDEDERGLYRGETKSWASTSLEDAFERAGVIVCNRADTGELYSFKVVEVKS